MASKKEKFSVGETLKRNNKDEPLPAGTYTTKDGKTLVVDAAGKIRKIISK